MSKTEHIHGTWMLDEQMSQFAEHPAIDVVVGGVDFQKRHIARIVQNPYKGTDVSENEMKANAKLIAAAPELLNILKELHKQMWDKGLSAHFDSKKIKEVIKKATS